MIYNVLDACCEDGDIVLDFQSSHVADTGFEDQLTKFLLGANNDRQRGQQKTSLNDKVAGQRHKLLLALQRGRKICRLEDIDEFFHQKYIREKFRKVADKIVWDI